MRATDDHSSDFLTARSGAFIPRRIAGSGRRLSDDSGCARISWRARRDGREIVRSGCFRFSLGGWLDVYDGRLVAGLVW